MKSLEQLQTAITNLSEKEKDELYRWLQDYREEKWDKQIQNDVNSGKLDHLVNKVKKDIENKQIKSLDEVLNNS